MSREHPPPRIPAPGRLCRAGAWLAAFALVASGIATLPRYGMTCDEAYGDLFFGERYLHYFLTLDPAYLDFRNHDLPIHRRVPDLYPSTWRAWPKAFPPLAGTISAASMELLGHRLRWMDPIDAFHAAAILLAGLLLVGLYHFAAPRLGPLPALVGVCLLGSYPRFWGDMHNNVKDVPETVAFTFTLIALARWHAAPSWARALGAGVLGGTALAIKLNAAFVPVILAVGLWPWERSRRPWAPVLRHLGQRWPHYLLMLASAALTYLAAWPWLHRSAFWRLGKHLLRLSVAATAPGQVRPSHPGWNPDPLVQTVATMPEAFLALFLAGLVVLAARLVRGADPSGTPRLLLAWAIVPILRSSLPGAVNFDGIRHFLEFLPAAALVAAVGAASLLPTARGAVRRAAAVLLALTVAANVGEALVRYHPFQMIYFNRLVGGLQGASLRHGFPEATDYWGSSYRAGMAWLGRRAEAGAVVYVPVFPHIVDLSAPLWLRPDLRVVDRSGFDASVAEGRAVYVMFITRASFYDDVAEECRRDRQPVHQIVVDGLPVLVIYAIAGTG